MQKEHIKTDLKHGNYTGNKVRKDLYVINYRFQGLAGKIYKTQKQCSQIRKILGLDLKKTTGGACQTRDYGTMYIT
jgi:hypothetical protein